ncbi:unnamed protein product [Anisakis simplex]|uniref:RBR-type E3 ubiquitin transferase n=1 Tax=Anisakis simplex TaxID=6269 RepID=A0A0M3JV21_ANISI|nr:unnamed protein product [Anisakis simplex]
MNSNESVNDSGSGSDDDADYYLDDYYNGTEYDVGESCDIETAPENDDPEYIEYNCLTVPQVERLLNETIERVAGLLNISQSISKLLLYMHKWNEAALVDQYKSNPKKTLTECKICSISNGGGLKKENCARCGVCARWRRDCGKMSALHCGHEFCVACWQAYTETQLSNAVSIRMGCMASECALLCPEDFVMEVLSDRNDLRAKYKEFVFRDLVTSHPELRFCPGRDCQMIVMAKSQKAKRVTCVKCRTSFCVLCGNDYHAPTSCETIRMWLIKCADDSETANYISAHTKDCPNCHSCIEKNGGCNHMQCAKCKHHFCWMCFGDWKTHGSEYYECSRYKENPSVAQEANHVKARRALEKYLHYYERYENHHKSLKLEEELRNSIMRKIDEKVNGHEGTWIDWQHLHRAATLLTKCRYTLQYTYPYAYYMENGPRKQLFEYQQAQLEKEIEELSWKVERAESTERGDLESQMHVAECKRRTLLQDFFD